MRNFCISILCLVIFASCAEKTVAPVTRTSSQPSLPKSPNSATLPPPPPAEMAPATEQIDNRNVRQATAEDFGAIPVREEPRLSREPVVFEEELPTGTKPMNRQIARRPNTNGVAANPAGAKPSSFTQDELRNNSPAYGNATPGNVDAAVSPDEVTELFQIRKTPCYGDCEQYTLQVMSDGELRLNGYKNTRLEGEHRFRPLAFRYAEMVAAFQRFTSEANSTYYPVDEEPPADLQATILEYTAGDGSRQKITVHYDAPETFEELLDLAEDVVENGKWEK